MRAGHHRQVLAVEADLQLATLNVQILHGAFCVLQIVRLALHQSGGVHIHEVIGEQLGDACIVFFNQGPAAFLLKCQELVFYGCGGHVNGSLWVMSAHHRLAIRPVKNRRSRCQPSPLAIPTP
ncbi:hypothetical protein D3C84_908620 [compost metagenome]